MAAICRGDSGPAPDSSLGLKPETNSNFGAVFPVWDLIFGTFRAQPRDGHERMRLGLDEVRGHDAQRPLWLLGSPLRGGLRKAGPTSRRVTLFSRRLRSRDERRSQTAEQRQMTATIRGRHDCR